MRILLLLWLMLISLWATPSLIIDHQEYHFDDFVLQRYEDKTSSLDIEALKKIKDFSIVSNSIAEGYSSSAFWYKVEVRNDTNRSVETVIDAEKLMNEIDLYVVSSLETLHYKGGNQVSFNDRVIQSTTTRFPLTLAKQETKTLYFRIKNVTTLFLILQIMDEKSLIQFDLFKFQILGLAYGGILILILYNFFLFIAIKEKIYLYYVSYVSTFALWQMIYEGYIPFTKLTGDMLYIISGNILSFFFIFLVLFSRELLLTRRYMPKLDKLLYVSIWIVSFSFLLNFYNPILLISTMNILGVIILSLLFLAAIKSYYLGNKVAVFYLYAQVVFLVTMFPFLLMNINILPFNVYIKYAPLVGIVYEIVVFSLALAYRIKVLKDEKIQEIQKNQKILAQQARLASMGEMLSSIAHQWRQPLNRINSNVSVLKSALRRDIIDSEILTEQTEMIEKNTKYMSNTIEDFANFFHPEKVETEFFLQNVIDKALNLIDIRTKNIEINIVLEKELKLFSFEKEYLQVLLIILNNAIDNFESKAIKEPKIDIVIKKYEGIVTLAICDNGGGVSEENIDSIFDPYFSTKFAKEGTGLGLYVAKMMIENSMHGQLQVENKNDGACFEMIIPNRI